MSLTSPVNDNDHALGLVTAKVEFVEYGDYECPPCAEVHKFLKDIHAQMGPQVRYVFRHMPLADTHPHAQLAAEAAEAAGAQGKFWEMHDALFEHQSNLSTDLMLMLAQNLKLDVDRFQKDMTSQRFYQHIQDDLTSAVQSGARGTPTFFINGERYTGSLDQASLTQVLESGARA